MNDQDISSEVDSTAPQNGAQMWWLLATISGILPWLCQPPLCWWPFALIAIVPLLHAATRPSIARKQWLQLYFAAVCYWAFTLQGLRHANPLIYPCWIALAAYLGCYPVLFVIATRRALRWGVPLVVAAPVAWVGSECLRNYLMTGISAAMLGHSMADLPVMIQIADLGGTYAVSFLLGVVNVALYSLLWNHWLSDRCDGSTLSSNCRFPVFGGSKASVAAAAVLVATSYGYGVFRLGQMLPTSETRLALIGRNEPVEYQQIPAQELERFDAYVRGSIDAFRSIDEPIQAVVWPESMYSGTLPWMMGNGSPRLAREQGLTSGEITAMIEERRRAFRFRSDNVLNMLAHENGPDQSVPDLIGGCGIVDYGDDTRVYSGIVQVGPGGDVKEWYGKTHLVMFGEYIPLVNHLPMVKDMMPPGMGLTTGDGPKLMRVGDLKLCPNICIETAVERVPLRHLQSLHRAAESSLPDAIVTVTNDGWFDDSSVVQHHKRCAQFVAVACRRPILSAANNGPTVWIDSCGRVVEEVPQGENGHLIVQPQLDARLAPVLRLGDWPARICLIAVAVFLVVGRNRQRVNSDTPPGPSPGDA